VTDYFLAMPNAAYSRDASGTTIKGKAKVDAYRRSLIKIEDIKNGYLRLEGPWEGWAEIALFKRTGGGYIVAHAENGCGPACSGLSNFGASAATSGPISPPASLRNCRALTRQNSSTEKGG
jgi:hypothetical protein